MASRGGGMSGRDGAPRGRPWEGGRGGAKRDAERGGGRGAGVGRQRGAPVQPGGSRGGEEGSRTRPRLPASPSVGQSAGERGAGGRDSPSSGAPAKGLSAAAGGDATDAFEGPSSEQRKGGNDALSGASSSPSGAPIALATTPGRSWATLISSSIPAGAETAPKPLMPPRAVRVQLSPEEELRRQAHLSRIDPATGKLHCLACRKALPSYPALMQHIKKKHRGVNSIEARYFDSDDEGDSSSRQHQTGAAPKPQPRAAVSLFDWMTPEKVTKTAATLQQRRTAPSLRPLHGSPRSAASQPPRTSSSPSPVLTLVPRPSSAGSVKASNAPADTPGRKRQALSRTIMASELKGAGVGLGGGDGNVGRLVLRGSRTKRMSSLKRAILKGRADMMMDKASARLQAAEGRASAIMSAARALREELDEAVDAARRRLEEVEASRGSGGAGVLPPEVFTRVQVLEVGVQQSDLSLAKIEAEVSKAREALRQAQKAHRKAYKIPDPEEEKGKGEEGRIGPEGEGVSDCQPRDEVDGAEEKGEDIQEAAQDLLGASISGNAEIADDKNELRASSFTASTEEILEQPAIGFFGSFFSAPCGDSDEDSESDDDVALPGFENMLSSWIANVPTSRRPPETKAAAALAGPRRSQAAPSQPQPAAKREVLHCKRAEGGGQPPSSAGAVEVHEAKGATKGQEKSTERTSPPTAASSLPGPTCQEAAAAETGGDSSSDDGVALPGFENTLSSWMANTHAPRRPEPKVLFANSLPSAQRPAGTALEASGAASAPPAAPSAASSLPFLEAPRKEKAPDTIPGEDGADTDDSDSEGFTDVLSAWMKSASIKTLPLSSETARKDLPTADHPGGHQPPPNQPATSVAGKGSVGQDARETRAPGPASFPVARKSPATSMTASAGPAPATLRGRTAAGCPPPQVKILRRMPQQGEGKGGSAATGPTNRVDPCPGDPVKSPNFAAKAEVPVWSRRSFSAVLVGGRAHQSAGKEEPSSAASEQKGGQEPKAEGPSGSSGEEGQAVQTEEGSGAGEGKKSRARPARELPRLAEELGLEALPGRLGGGQQLWCSVCGVHVCGAETFRAHCSSRRHLGKLKTKATEMLQAEGARHRVEAAGEGGREASAPKRPNSLVGKHANTREYCQQIITPELNTLVDTLLRQLKAFQDRAITKDPIKGKIKKRILAGLREVAKAVKLKKAHSVIVVPNIESIGSEGGLDDRLQSILDMASANGTPVVFALSLKKLGMVLGQRKRSSAVAILDVNGANESAAEMLKLAEDGRREWKELQAAEAAKLREDALSKDQQAAAGPMEEPRDELGDDGGKGGLMSDTLGQPPPNMGTKLNASASAFVPSWVK